MAIRRPPPRRPRPTRPTRPPTRPTRPPIKRPSRPVSRPGGLAKPTRPRKRKLGGLAGARRGGRPVRY